MSYANLAVEKQGRIHGHKPLVGGLKAKALWTDQPTDGLMDKWTDTPSYRVALPHLEMNGQWSEDSRSYLKLVLYCFLLNFIHP